MGSHGITYLWRGENLGGLGANRLLPETVAEVAEMATTATGQSVQCVSESALRRRRPELLAAVRDRPWAAADAS